MLVIDVKTVYEYAGMVYDETPTEDFLGASIADYVYSTLVDLGFSPVNGRYVGIPDPIRSQLSWICSSKMMGVPSTTLITLNKVHHFVYVNIGR